MPKEHKAEPLLFLDEVNIPMGSIDARPRAQKTEIIHIHTLPGVEEPTKPIVVGIIRATDGYPNEAYPACGCVTEDGEQCQYDKGHEDPCSFDEQPDEDEFEVTFTVLKERNPAGLPFEIIDGSGFLGLTAEMEDDDEQ